MSASMKIDVPFESDLRFVGERYRARATAALTMAQSRRSAHWQRQPVMRRSATLNSWRPRWLNDRLAGHVF